MPAMFSLETITTNFIFFAGGVSLLVSLGELLVRHRRVENYIFCALLFCFGILMFQIGFIANGDVAADPRILYLHMTFLYLVGPIGYFAYFLIILPRDTLPGRMALYLVPSIIALAFDAYYIAMPTEITAGINRAIALYRRHGPAAPGASPLCRSRPSDSPVSGRAAFPLSGYLD